MGVREVKVLKVAVPTEEGCAVLLGDEEKSFAIFIGIYEGAALIREVNGETTPRPLTHDLIQRVLDGFDVSVKAVLIYKVEDGTFHAWLVLEQACVDAEGEPDGRRNEVRLECRPSDCLVIALKEKKPILVADEVFDALEADETEDEADDDSDDEIPD